MNLHSVVSADDPRLLDYRQLANPSAIRRAGLFVAEGRFVVQRLLALQRHQLHSLLVTSTALRALTLTRQEGPGVRTGDQIGSSGDRIQGLGDRTSGVPVYVVHQHVMDDIVGFNIHRGCLALAHRPAARTLDDVMVASLTRVLVLEGVNNPDNVGGVFRSAAAFGADAVVLGPACGDPLYRKAIRTSMAATLRVPFVDAGEWPRAIEILRAHGLRVLALSTSADAQPLEEFSRAGVGRVALVVGNEGHGLTASALAACSDRVRISMTTAVDSLNVSVAASIAMHHLF